MDSYAFEIGKNSKSFDVKNNGYFEYLKSFSEAGLETLHKLESDFNSKSGKKNQEK